MGAGALAWTSVTTFLGQRVPNHSRRTGRAGPAHGSLRRRRDPGVPAPVRAHGDFSRPWRDRPSPATAWVISLIDVRQQEAPPVPDRRSRPRGSAIWHESATRRLIATHNNKAQVDDLGLHHGAGDEDRTRALSLGSYGACGTKLLLTWVYALSRRGRACGIAPLLTLDYRSYGHAMGTPSTGGVEILPRVAWRAAGPSKPALAGGRRCRSTWGRGGDRATRGGGGSGRPRDAGVLRFGRRRGDGAGLGSGQEPTLGNASASGRRDR